MQCAWVVARSYEVSLHTAVLADGLLGGFNRLAVDALGDVQRAALISR